MWPFGRLGTDKCSEICYSEAFVRGFEFPDGGTGDGSSETVDKWSIAIEECVCVKKIEVVRMAW